MTARDARRWGNGFITCGLCGQPLNFSVAEHLEQGCRAAKPMDVDVSLMTKLLANPPTTGDTP